MFENGLVNHQNWSRSSERYFRDEPEERKKAAVFPKGDRSDNVLFLLEDRDASSGLTSGSMVRVWDCVDYILLIFQVIIFLITFFLTVTFCKTLSMQNKKHGMRNSGPRL